MSYGEKMLSRLNVPGLALLILTLAVNLLGDALRDALDPKVQ